MACIEHAACIGGGWAARFVLNGIDVAVHDPDSETGNHDRSEQGTALPGLRTSRRCWRATRYHDRSFSHRGHRPHEAGRHVRSHTGSTGRVAVP